jgi:DNA repair protein RAD5
MGLGKTVEMLSLIHAVKYHQNRFDVVDEDSSSTYEQYPTTNTTLIVCPMSLLSQWRDEVNNTSDQDALSVEMYYGNKKRNSWNLNDIRDRKARLPDVLLTTYGVLMHEYEKKDKQTSLLFNGNNDESK